MGFKYCKSCNKPFGGQAQVCPHCGTHHTNRIGGLLKSTAKWSLIITGTLVLIGFCAKKDDAPNTKQTAEAPASSAAAEITPSDAPPEKSEAQATESIAAASLCQSDLQCWADKNWAEADAYCQRPVERLGKYTSRWTDATLERKFDRYAWRNKEQGIITYAGDKIEFQNGFGAFQPHKYYCDYDTRSKQVLNVWAEPGRF